MTVSSSNDEVRRLIAMDQGIDSELGIVGLGYSPDNGLHFFVTNTIKGRVFRQEDADRLWPFMKGFVSRQIKESLVVNWDDIKGKPNVALKSDLPDLSGYALKDDLPAPVDLSGYAKADAVEVVKATAESALSNAEKAQSTADANSKALANKVDRNELPVIPTDLVHAAELDQVRANITKAQQMATDAAALANSVKVTIDTTNLHQVKKPSEYSEGFSYEVKSLSDLGIDLTKYDTSVQNGWIGLVKSARVSIFSSVYVTQTVRVLGSYRPTTFIRNGSSDSWYPWELITTW
ncbi:hypothetical protein [Limosilactobacillus antri]|uniref:hypothetical protein n=1 Tax=Limosilactobacillus antri TaxID=227943 RepID=UPI001F5A0282|nr:hypothetical protein [Limosilactobacillus antri]